MSTNEKSVDSFLQSHRTAKSKVAVIVPLYGYWKDIKKEDRQLDLDSLRTTLNRVHSLLHEVYIFFVAEPNRLPKEIASELQVRMTAGNVKCVPVNPLASYGEYVREGIRVALEETNVKFVSIINPWVIIQHEGLDIMIERLNRTDVGAVSGFDIKTLISNDQDKMAKEFDEFSPQIPIEQRALSFDFIGMTRYGAEIIQLDPKYQSHIFVERDTWQEFFAKGFSVITTQRVPIYPFDLDWSLIESTGLVETDRKYFISKWHFDPRD